jgi:flagellar basal body-associated protein FliL
VNPIQDGLMAEEDIEKQEDDLTAQEAEELDRLLEEGGSKEPGEEGKPEDGPQGSFIQKSIKRLKTDKKFLLLVGGSVLLVILAGGAGLYLTFSEAPQEADDSQAEPQESEQPQEIQKAHIYQLEPFFLPLNVNERETGQFITVTPNLLLSNSALDDEIDKILPQIRKSIYNILRRKNPEDFFQSRVNQEERIKKEILAATNANLLSGTGTITDVFYTQFLVK